MERPASFLDSVKTYLPGEEFEYQHFYKMLTEYAEKQQSPLAKYAYAGAAAAERVHASLLKQAEDMDAFKEKTIYVCPVCGGPKRQYQVFEELGKRSE